MSGPRGSKIPLMAGTLIVGISAGALTLSPELRYRAYACAGRSRTKKMLRLLAVLFTLSSFKNIPFLWHFRIFKAFIYQIYFQRQPWKPEHLFAPMITSSWNSLADCDYNFHKSNSTYFADLDISRAHLVSAIVRVGVRRLNRGDEGGLPQDTRSGIGSYSIALGGVACMFQREIEPMAQFDVYSRVLSWDRKWLYIVSHIVKGGKIRTGSYVMQPWKKGEQGYGEKVKQEEAELAKYVYATSISRYVVKKGRLTVNPEIVLERSRLLPPRPEGVGLPPRSEKPTEDVSPSADSRPEISGPERGAAAIASKLGSDEADAVDNNAGWTWDEMEAERLRGLKYASHFDALSGLYGELRTDEVLGRFSDWF